MASKVAILRAFRRARRFLRSSPAAIARYQLEQLRQLPGLVASVTVDDALACLPILSPADFTAEFAARNVLGVSLEEARRRAQVELGADEAADRDLSYGLSTGSTGEPGVFLTTAAERAEWIGTILGRFFSLRELMRPRGLTIALLLKHNSRLYTDVAATGRLRLHYFDLRQPLAEWVKRLVTLRPDVLVAPPSVLLDLLVMAPATVRRVRPDMVIAAGEPLFPNDRVALTVGFGVAARGLYQAKEGFLAYGCVRRRLHLNEDLMVFEGQRFPSHPDRVVPVITDFARRSQSYWRYRMDDVLLCDPTPCTCGSPFTSVLAVEGRLADVLLRDDGTPVFPLELDAALTRHLAPGARSALLQHAPGHFTLRVDEPVPDSLREALWSMLRGDGSAARDASSSSPVQGDRWLEVAAYVPPAPGEKLRRFRRLFDPDSEELTRVLLPPQRLSP